MKFASRNVTQHLFTCFIVVLLQACQLFSPAPDEKRIDKNSLAALQPAVINLPKTSISTLDVSEVIESYSQLLPLLTDPEKQLKVLHRLADLKLQKGEWLMAEQAKDELDIAISAYHGLLAKYPERRDNDKVLYQLAKTYELKGEAEKNLEILTRLVKEYPNSMYIAEVQFRRGEILFAWSNYQFAKEAFEAVIAEENPTFMTNAYYMLGWSIFKQNDYALALDTFSVVLDRIFEAHRELLVSDLTLVQAHQTTLVNDLLRVMGLSFSYLGTDSLSALFERIGQKHYEVLVYSHYSDLLQEKEQYSNAIKVYQAFIQQHPMNLWAPRFHINVIDTLAKAKFTTNLYDEKVSFVEQYGLGSDFWNYHQDNPSEIPAYAETDHLAFTKTQLESFLIELADIAYIKGQNAEKQRSTSIKTPSNEMKQHFAQASAYNEQFVATFPGHPDNAKRLFLLGESEFKIHNWLAAISAYETVGYNFPDFAKASEAAYASVVAYKEFSQTWPSLSLEQAQQWRQAEQANRLRFVDGHPQDPRALDVLFVALSYQYNSKDFQRSLSSAERLLAWPNSFEGAPSAKPLQIRESLLIKAHSLYALNRFAEAEIAYVNAINHLEQKDPRRVALIENLAASVYKQAEALLAQDMKQDAVHQLLRVGKVAPSSSLRQNAEYDAANYLLELKQWPEAISVLTEFRAAYPKHNLINTLPAKLALAYRETAQWSLAADELKRMVALAKTAQEKQDISFIVAELYDKAENTTQAILSYRSYANAYPKPADVYMEAANRLAELYQQTKVPLKRRFWLAKQMKTVDRLGDKADDRMRYLAAQAASVLANDAFIQYKAVRLSLPLDKSLAKKTKALQTALEAYQKTTSYGISEFSTEAGYRMAELYSHLSRSLMDSDRPDNLNELELEQYEILLEEQVYPFEDNAIDIHEQNASRAWNGLYDEWVKKSFSELKQLLPGRYGKEEEAAEVINVLQ
ncbi:MAG: tetratricopeptide repeat protein [Oleiphilus sp.]